MRKASDPESLQARRHSALNRRHNVQTEVRIPVRLVGGLAILVMLGTALLLLPVMGKHEPLKFDQAIFTAVSALSVTGLSIITPYNDLSYLGKFVLLTLIQIGGVGYMVLAVVAFRLIGKKVVLADRLALRDALGLVSHRGILQLTTQIMMTVALIELAGAFILWLNWRSSIPGLEGAFYALFHAVSAFCNAGFDLFTGRPGYPTGVPNDTITVLVMATLIFLGSIGIPVLFDLITYHWRKRLSLHTRITLPIVFGLIIVGTVGLEISEGLTQGILHHEPLYRQILLSTAQVVSARTAGFTFLPTFTGLEPSSELLLTISMFIGSSPASMGGGITTGTFGILALALWAQAKGQSTPIIEGRAIPGEMIRRGAAVLTISLALVLFATWIILVTHRTSMALALFEVTSAFATCGLSMGLTGELNTTGKIVIMMMMFWGRLGALTIIVALTRSRPPKRITYPEEKILIG